MNCTVTDAAYARLGAAAEAQGSSRAHELQKVVDGALNEEAPRSGLDIDSMSKDELRVLATQIKAAWQKYAS